MGAALALTEDATGLDPESLPDVVETALDGPANGPAYPPSGRYTYDAAVGTFLYEEYHPFGTSAYRAVDSTIEVSPKRYRYAAAERDEETGLDHMGLRYYAPWLGRWTSADPIGLGDGVNRYAYVRGNPVSMRDPRGTRTEPATETFDPSIEGFDPKTGEIRREVTVRAEDAPQSEPDFQAELEAQSAAESEAHADIGDEAPSEMLDFEGEAIVPEEQEAAVAEVWDRRLGVGKFIARQVSRTARVALAVYEAGKRFAEGDTITVRDPETGEVVGEAVRPPYGLGYDITGDEEAVRRELLGRHADESMEIQSNIGGRGSGAGGGSLRRRLGTPPTSMKKPQAHHDLPQKYRSRFEKAGLDIDDPKHGRWVEGGPRGRHQKWSRKFNEEWDRFFARNPNASKNQILRFMRKLRNDPRFQ